MKSFPWPNTLQEICSKEALAPARSTAPASARMLCHNSALLGNPYNSSLKSQKKTCGGSSYSPRPEPMASFISQACQKAKDWTFESGCHAQPWYTGEVPEHRGCLDQQSCGEGPPELRACYSHPCGNHVAHGVELMMTVRFGKSEIHIFSCIILLQIHQKGGRLSKEDREYRL